jgi:hypothetical protein
MTATAQVIDAYLRGFRRAIAAGSCEEPRNGSYAAGYSEGVLALGVAQHEATLRAAQLLADAEAVLTVARREAL